jgi:hypothetical protein
MRGNRVKQIERRVSRFKKAMKVLRKGNKQLKDELRAPMLFRLRLGKEKER